VRHEQRAFFAGFQHLTCTQPRRGPFYLYCGEGVQVGERELGEGAGGVGRLHFKKLGLVS
jgi:hypothetical protein